MKIYYINKNSCKQITILPRNYKSIKLYSLGFLPYIHLFRGSTQLYLLFLTVFILAVVAAIQQVIGFKSKADKMKEELDNYNLKNRYLDMLSEKSTSFNNANTKTVSEED